MTQEDEDQHAELERLFDRTASEASGPTLTKLAARARDIPRLTQKAHFFPRWVYWPLFAGTALALGGVLALRTRPPAPSEPTRTATSAMTSKVAVASASACELENTPHLTASDEASDNLELLGEADEGARFDVSGPQSDRDLDAWLAATKELSDGT